LTLQIEIDALDVAGVVRPVQPIELRFRPHLLFRLIRSKAVPP
jgi:hypothetical protein